MAKIALAGFEAHKEEQKRKLFYNGVECPFIARREILCESDTSYNGCVLDSWETYQSPIGVIERHYWARGAGLERSGKDWRLVPSAEISELQVRFTKLSAELAEVVESLKAFNK